MAFDPVAYVNHVMDGYISNVTPLEEMFYVKGKVAIVTGGTSGLGFCIAQRLCQGGANVVITGSSDAKAEKAMGLLHQAGYENVSFCKTDVRSEKDVENMLDFTVKTYGTVDILVTSAAVWGFAHVYDMPEEEFMRVVDVNLNGTFRCVKHVSKHMVDHGIQGKIVLIASNSALLSQPVFGGYVHYVASKGGVIAMTQEVAKELKRYGIMVNCVAPGGMETPGGINNRVCKALTEEQQAEMNKELRVAKMDEVPSADSVAIVAYALCTKMADGMTGEHVVVDRGMLRNIFWRQPAIQQYPPEETPAEH